MASETAAYPVQYEVEPQLTDRNRVTTLFRIILAIPHLILVGGPGLSGGAGWRSGDGVANYAAGMLAGGVLVAVGGIMAFVSWFAIVFTGKHPRGLWDFQANILRWRARSNAYIALLRDEYPPFSFDDAAYPARISLGEYPETRNRVTVGFRLIFLIPHVIVLLLVGIAWAVTAFIGWLAILFTGSYPSGLYDFAIGYLRWSFRLEAYANLLNDEFPPFSLK